MLIGLLKGFSLFRVGAPESWVGPSGMIDYQGFRIKTGPQLGLKTMLWGAKRAVLRTFSRIRQHP